MTSLVDFRTFSVVMMLCEYFHVYNTSPYSRGARTWQGVHGGAGGKPLQRNWRHFVSSSLSTWHRSTDLHCWWDSINLMVHKPGGMWQSLRRFELITYIWMSCAKKYDLLFWVQLRAWNLKPEQIWVHLLALILSNCVYLNKFLNLCQLWFLTCK